MTNTYSICIGAYNVEKYIDECIKSVLNQTFSNFELVIVDDCSTDKTGQILDKYAKEDNRIKVFHNEINKGPFYSKLKAIENANGDYLMYMDADDYYETNTIEEVNKIIEKDNPDLICFSFRKIYSNKKEDSNLGIDYKYFDDSNRSEFLLEVLTKSKYNTLWSKVVKRNVIKDKLNIPSKDIELVRRGDDHYISLEIYKNVHTIVITNKILYNYRINNEGLTIGQKKNYNFHYRNREKTVEFINSENCLSNKDKELLNKQAVHKFINQLEEISHFSISSKEKEDIFNRIKETKYYNNYLIKQFNINNSFKIKLFINCKYNLLITICKIEQSIYRMLGK